MNDNTSFIRGGNGNTKGGKGSSLSNEPNNRVNHFGNEIKNNNLQRQQNEDDSLSVMGQSGAKDNFSIAEERRTNSINSKAESKVSRSSKYNGININ